MAGDNDDLLDQAESESLLSTAIAPEFELSNRLADARPYELQPFDVASDAPPVAETVGRDVEELELTIELGRTKLPVEGASALREGAVVPLDQLAGDPVDIVLGNRLIGRGEVLVMNECLCVRVAEILGPSIDPAGRSIVG